MTVQATLQEVFLRDHGLEVRGSRVHQGTDGGLLIVGGGELIETEGALASEGQADWKPM